MPLVTYKFQSSSQSKNTSTEHGSHESKFTGPEIIANASYSDLGPSSTTLEHGVNRETIARQLPTSRYASRPHDTAGPVLGGRSPQPTPMQPTLNDNRALQLGEMKELSGEASQLYTRDTNSHRPSDISERIREAQEQLTMLKSDRPTKERKARKPAMRSGEEGDKDGEDSSEDEEYPSTKELPHDKGSHGERSERSGRKPPREVRKSNTMPPSQQYYPNGVSFTFPGMGPPGAGPSFHPQHPFPVAPLPVFGSPIFAPRPYYEGAPPHGAPPIVSNQGSGNVQYSLISDIGNDYSKNYTATRRPKKTR